MRCTVGWSRRSRPVASHPVAFHFVASRFAPHVTRIIRSGVDQCDRWLDHHSFGDRRLATVGWQLLAGGGGVKPACWTVVTGGTYFRTASVGSPAVSPKSNQRVSQSPRPGVAKKHHAGSRCRKSLYIKGIGREAQRPESLALELQLGSLIRTASFCPFHLRVRA